MEGGIDLDAYAARVGYGGPREASLEVLRALHRLHPAAIPFESLDPLLGRPVPIDGEALERKLVRGRRGGYCFEQNGVLWRVLAALGFDVVPLAARVLWNRPPGARRPALSHMLLQVNLPEGPFLADVGFGGSITTQPLRLDTDAPQATPHGVYRIVADGAARELQLQTPEGWRALYRFTLEPQSYADYEAFNWFTATHPRSRFTNNLVASRIVGDRRIGLLNRERTVRLPDGSSERSVLPDAAAAHRVLSGEFGLDVSLADIEGVWARLPWPETA